MDINRTADPAPTTDTYEVERLDVVGGGSRFELIAQLMDIGRYQTRAPFPLVINHPDESARPRGIYRLGDFTLDTVINGITADDGSGNNWNISGFVALNQSRTVPEWLRAAWGGSLYRFTGFYDTRTRHGFLKPID